MARTIAVFLPAPPNPIKFFSIIRHRLITENKFSKYLLYSIGEILIVIIGILIALNINNWNENRENSITEIKIIKEMKINLKIYP